MALRGSKERDQFSTSNRCYWVSDSGQCCNWASMGQTQLGGGTWYCKDHFACLTEGEAKLGDDIVIASKESAPRDWSNETRMELAMKAYDNRYPVSTGHKLTKDQALQNIGLFLGKFSREPGQEG